jgi:hypothetical protein
VIDPARRATSAEWTLMQLLQLNTGTSPGATGDTQNNLVINQF